jgi:hypothetical protein
MILTFNGEGIIKGRIPVIPAPDFSWTSGCGTPEDNIEGLGSGGFTNNPICKNYRLG